MKAFELIGEVDEAQHLIAVLPEYAPPGPVRVIVLMPETTSDKGEELWMQGIAHEWQAELADERQDIYTLEDGEPLDATR